MPDALSIYTKTPLEQRHMFTSGDGGHNLIRP